jgi:hypothetical protein
MHFFSLAVPDITWRGDAMGHYLLSNQEGERP